MRDVGGRVDGGWLVFVWSREIGVGFVAFLSKI